MRLPDGIGYGIPSALTDLLSPDGIRYRISSSLTDLIVAHGIGHRISPALADLLSADGIGYGITSAFAYLIVAHGIGYGIAPALTDLFLAAIGNSMVLSSYKEVAHKDQTDHQKNKCDPFHDAYLFKFCIPASECLHIGRD